MIYEGEAIPVVKLGAESFWKSDLTAESGSRGGPL
jgi:hypothetical protein